MRTKPFEILKRYWGHESFRGSQEAIISAVLEERDVLALLPTGGGKSICFQIPAMVKEGLCIVVSPLVALIHNQVDELKNKGIKAIALAGSIPQDELTILLDNSRFGHYKFLYLSPERLKQDMILQKIELMNVNLIAIDEAHCISQWGHDFRPAYLECDKLRAVLPETPVIALTATATEQVSKDIIDNLKFIEPLVVKDSFSRNNIAFKVIRAEDKRYLLKQLCAKTDRSVIVYVRNRRLTVEISRYLKENDVSADFFHGGLDTFDKKQKLEQWLNDTTKVMVATNAFGMGIDKSDVSLVIHFQIPDCIENYFQEAGRAGRDGTAAEAVLLTNTSDEDLVSSQFLSVLPDTPFLKRVYNKLNNYFQVSYGELMDETYQFDLHSFCNTYRLNTLLTYNALRILDRNSVISLSESFSKKTEIKFICSKEALFDFLSKNHQASKIVRSILRTYGGLFDFETKINLGLIAKKTNVPQIKVDSVLEQLKINGLVQYRAQKADIEIHFLVPREDDITINAFVKRVEELHRIKIEKLDAMLAYVRNTSICRNHLLLSYFGENKKDCNKCDVCTKDLESEILTETDQKIIASLKNGKKSSRALINELGVKNSEVLKVLQYLLEDGKIKINSKNEYEIVK